MTKVSGRHPVAQGDFILVPVDAIPTNAKAAKPNGNHFIVAHSETGHNHVIERTRAEVFEAADDEFIAFIRTLGDGATIEHQRSFDTHAPIELPPNQSFRVHRQREHTPEGWRRAAD